MERHGKSILMIVVSSPSVVVQLEYTSIFSKSIYKLAACVFIFCFVLALCGVLEVAVW